MSEALMWLEEAKRLWVKDFATDKHVPKMRTDMYYAMIRATNAIKEELNERA